MALCDFDERARPNLQRIQAMARASMNWYEHAGEHLDGGSAVDAAYAMAGRNSSRPAGRYLRFRLEQLPVVRRPQAALKTVHRLHMAARRGELPLVPSWHPGPPPPGRPPHLAPGTPGPQQAPAPAVGGTVRREA
jgi:hypothetical protein